MMIGRPKCWTAVQNTAKSTIELTTPTAAKLAALKTKARSCQAAIRREMGERGWFTRDRLAAFAGFRKAAMDKLLSVWLSAARVVATGMHDCAKVGFAEIELR